MNITVRVHEDFDLGGGVALLQGIHTIDSADLEDYEEVILDGRMFFALEINQFEALNLQLNQQIYTLYRAMSNVASVEIPVTAITSSIEQTALNTSKMSPDTFYIAARNAAQVEFPLPETASVGDLFYIRGKSTLGWRISQNAGQTIQIGNLSTTTGTGGFVSSINPYDSIVLQCVTENTTFIRVAGRGKANTETTAYDETLWNGDLDFPTKDAVRDILINIVAASNVGNAFNPAVFKQKLNGILEFRRIIATSPINATQNENDITFTLGSIDALVRAAGLAGLPVGNENIVTSGDSVLSAFGKHVFQIATIGSEWLNLKRLASWTGGADITNAVNEATTRILNSNPKSGQLLVPRGDWYGNGGHSIPDSTQIKADGYSLSADGVFRGTMYRLNSGSPYNYIFGIFNNVHNVSISQIGLDCSAKQSSGIGVWIYGTTGNYHLKNELESVYFLGGLYGIKNESAFGTHFQNDGFSAFFCSFKDVRSAFYCNSINGSFYFYKPVIYLPTAQPIWGYSSGGTAFDVQVIGTLIVDGHHIAGQGSYDAYGDPTDNSVILRTAGQANRIAFYRGQDEKVKWFYYNGTTNHYPGNPIILRDNGGIQSQFYSTANISFILDSNYITNRVGYPTFIDSTTGAIYVFKEGQNFVETRAASTVVSIVGTSEVGNSILTAFGNQKSRVVDLRGSVRSPNGSPDAVYDSGAIWNKPYRMPPTDTNIGNGGVKVVNSSEGMVRVASGVSSFSIYNNTMYYNSADDCSIVDAYIEGSMSSGISVESVTPNISGTLTYFTVTLNGFTDDVRKVFFKVR